jgi:hypothetical protein
VHGKEALVEYTARGRDRHVLVWGAINARVPNEARPQVHFKLDYSGGLATRHRFVWKRFVDQCSPYDGPPLVYLVAACRAPDGSYWAVQAWQRLLPMRGFDPWLPQQSAYEFHVSHWTGLLAELEVSPNWTYGGTWQGLFGRLMYAGYPVYGFRTPSATSRDAYARYVYIDTFNSAYGPGWKRDGAKVTHIGNGGFCYSFAPLAAPPPGYPGVPSVSGRGERHRITVMGPGVTPDVEWEGAALGAYDPDADRAFNLLFDSILGGDNVCKSER